MRDANVPLLVWFVAKRTAIIPWKYGTEFLPPPYSLYPERVRVVLNSIQQVDFSINMPT